MGMHPAAKIQYEKKPNLRRVVVSCRLEGIKLALMLRYGMNVYDTELAET